MANISKALEGKAQKTLNTLVRYSEGVMTRKEFIELKHKQGARVEISTKNKIQYSRTKFNRMWNERDQDEYMKKCDEKVICYNLHPEGENYYNEITKTEYDYFLTL